jgi:glutamate-1-semialdehyde 2,1-aminomutase
MNRGDYLSQYREKTPRSIELYRRSARVTPGGVSHRYRHLSPHPFFMQAGSGARVWDVDGNEYIDLWMGHFALILGHKPAVFKEALEEVGRAGPHWGLVHEYQVQFGELLQEVVPCAEKLIFGVSGTEATMYAVRLARAFTRKSTVLKVAGGWHGGSSELVWAVNGPFDRPESAGLAPGIDGYTRAIRYNDPEATLAAIHSAKDDLAGVIVEPALGGCGFITADPSYLELLRAETRKLGALLIFDEVITGCRMALGGAQTAYGITPDLATLGKVVGGGANLGVIAGRGDVLALCDPTIKREKGAGVVVGGGTFSCSPMSMILGCRTVQYLKTHAATLYPAIDRRGRRLREGMVAALERHGVRAGATGTGSLCGLYLPRHAAAAIKSPEDLEKLTDAARLEQEFRIRMINHGVFTMHGAGAVSLAHSDEDIEKIIAAVEAVAEEMAASASPGAEKRRGYGG